VPEVLFTGRLPHSDNLWHHGFPSHALPSSFGIVRLSIAHRFQPATMSFSGVPRLNTGTTDSGTSSNEVPTADIRAGRGGRSPFSVVVDGPHFHRMVKHIFQPLSTNRAGPDHEDMMFAYASSKTTQIVPFNNRILIPGDVNLLFARMETVRDSGKWSMPAPEEARSRALDHPISTPVEAHQLFYCNLWVGNGKGRIDWDLEREHRTIDLIKVRVAECLVNGLSTDMWGSSCIGPLIYAALKPFGTLVTVHDVADSALVNRYMPDYGVNLWVPTRMVEYAITYGSPSVTRAVEERLRDNRDRRSINHIDCEEIKDRPIGAGVVVVHDGGSEIDYADMIAPWAAAYFARLRDLARTVAPLDITLPMLVVVSGDWKIMFVADRAAKTHIIGSIPCGNMRTVVGCYRLIAIIRWLGVYVNTVFRAWLAGHALGVGGGRRLNSRAS